MAERKRAKRRSKLRRPLPIRPAMRPEGGRDRVHQQIITLVRERGSICRRDLIEPLGLEPMKVTRILQSMVASRLLEKHGGSTWAFYTLPDEKNPRMPATMELYMRSLRLDKLNESRRRRGLPPLTELPD